MVQRIMISLTVAGLMLLQITPSLGDAKQCAADVVALMQKNQNALGDKTIRMLKAYNETCTDNDLCEYTLDEDTKSYVKAVTSYNPNLNLPDVPMIGNGMADFEGFSSHESFSAYVDLCLNEGGHVKFVDSDLRLKGTAMDLVDLDITGKVKSFPMCLVDGCEGEDLEEVLEEAVKYAVIENAVDLSAQQQTVINSMNIALACAASGIQTCELSVKDSADLKNLKSAINSFSGAVSIAGHATAMFMTVFGVWATLN